MTLEEYKRRVHVAKFLDNPIINEIKEDIDGFPWERLQIYADEYVKFEKAPPEDRE
jgi:hypothetical protein